MDIKKILSQIDSIQEGSMADAVNHQQGPHFGGYWKGTDKNPPKPGQGFGGEGKENMLKGFERELKENPRRMLRRDLAQEYAQFKADSEEELKEYGGVGGYGAASQAPQGTGSTAQQPDPKAVQQVANQSQIQKSTNLISPTLNSQGAAEPVNKVKFQDVMNKLDATPNTELGAGDQKQLGSLGVAASKALKNPQTANQLKQVITKADQMDQQQQQKVKQAQQSAGTNAPAGQQAQKPGQPTQPSAGQTS